MSRVELDFTHEQFEALRVKVDKLLQKIKSADFENILIDEVNFDLVIAEKRARIYESQIKKSQPKGTT